MAIQMARAFGHGSPPPRAQTKNAAFASVSARKSPSTIRSQALGHGDGPLGPAPRHRCILDMIGGDYFPSHVDLLATGGRLVQIAFSHGSQVTLDLRTMMTKRLLVTGSTLRPAYRRREVFAGSRRGAGSMATVHKRTDPPGRSMRPSPGTSRRCPPADGVRAAYREDRCVDNELEELPLP